MIKYTINGIEISVEKGSKRWNKSICQKLKWQLDGFGGMEKGAFQKMVFRDYDRLQVGSFDGSIVIPECSLFFEDLFVDFNKKIAFKLSKNLLEVWINENTWFSVPFFLQMLLLERGIAFVHGAAISINGKGILLPAFGGIGKTAFISEAAKIDSVKILGDDLLLLDKNSYIYPYLRPFCLYQYHDKLFPQFFDEHKNIIKSLSIYNRIKRKTKYMLKINDNTVYSYISVPPYKLFEKSKLEKNKIPICCIFILKRIKGLSHINKSECISAKAGADFCIAVLAHEFYEFINMLLNYFGLTGKGLENYVQKFMKIYSEAFKNKLIQYIEIPEHMPINDMALQLRDIVLSNNNKLIY